MGNDYVDFRENQEYPLLRHVEDLGQFILERSWGEDGEYTFIRYMGIEDAVESLHDEVKYVKDVVAKAQNLETMALPYISPETYLSNGHKFAPMECDTFKLNGMYARAKAVEMYRRRGMIQGVGLLKKRMARCTPHPGATENGRKEFSMALATRKLPSTLLPRLKVVWRAFSFIFAIF